MLIAVCGQLGAGCTEIGQMLAKKLGLKCISSSDVVKAIVTNFRDSFAEFEQRVRSGEVDIDVLIESKLKEFLDQNHGKTLVEGRSAFMLLNTPDTFKVLLVSPKEARAKHIAKRRNIPLEEAEREIRHSDSERRNFVERLYDKDWVDASNYDVVLNTGHRDYKDITKILLATIKALSVPTK